MKENEKTVNNSNAESIHVWNHCHHCGENPIVGLRYQCRSCPAGPHNDLCETCYEKLLKGEITHPAEYSPGAGMVIANHHFDVFEGKPVAMFEKWLRVSHPAAPDPAVTDHFVVRPVFCSQGDAAIGGYAFVVSLEDHTHPLLLTALHVMDEMIKKKGIDCTGKNKNYTGKELPAVITEVNIYDVFAPQWMMAPLGLAGPMLILPGAGTGEEEPVSDRDIAAFHIKEADIRNLNSRPLAQQAPGVGEPVWLTGKREDQPGKRTMKAVVTEKAERSFVFMFEDREAERPKSSSGAPILNKNGDVVGINVGGGRFKGEKFGHANHVENIRKHLSACKDIQR